MCRYGHQPVNVVKRMPLSELQAFAEALTRLVERENDTSETDG